MSPHITPADVAAIVDQIAAGIAPVDRSTGQPIAGATASRGRTRGGSIFASYRAATPPRGASPA